MKRSSAAVTASVVGMAAIGVIAVAVPLQAAQGAAPGGGKPSPSPTAPAPTGPTAYSETAGISSLGSGPTIVVQAPLTAAGVTAGDYLVNATVVVSEPQDGSASTVSCNLQMGSVDSPMSYQYVLDGINGGGTHATIPLLHLYRGVNAGAHVAVTCWSTGDGGPAQVVNATVTAVQVDAAN